MTILCLDENVSLATHLQPVCRRQKNYLSNQDLPREKSNVFISPNYTLPRVKLNIW